MFWDRFYSLCLDQKTKPNPVAKELNISSGAVTQWKQGVIPKGDILIKIAQYFNVSTDYLLGLTNQKQSSGCESSEPVSGEIHALLEKCKQLSHDDLQMVVDFIDLLNLRKKQTSIE